LLPHPFNGADHSRNKSIFLKQRFRRGAARVATKSKIGRTAPFGTFAQPGQDEIGGKLGRTVDQDQSPCPERRYPATSTLSLLLGA
jgi:hypothetical protein